MTRETLGRRGRKADAQWANRRRLLTGRKRLANRSFTRMWNQLADAGDPGVQILLAYTVKEDLRQLLDLAGTNPDREFISHRLYTFYDQAAASRAPEVHRLAATIEAWWPAIEAGLITGYSNARSEGYIIWSPLWGVIDVADGSLVVVRNTLSGACLRRGPCEFPCPGCLFDFRQA